MPNLKKSILFRMMPDLFDLHPHQHIHTIDPNNAIILPSFEDFRLSHPQNDLHSVTLCLEYYNFRKNLFGESDAGHE